MSALLQTKSPRKHGYGTVVDGNPTRATGQGIGGAPFFSRLLFSFANPLFKVGNERQLDMNDMWDLEGENDSATALKKFKKAFDKCNGSIPRAIVSV